MFAGGSYHPSLRLRDLCFERHFLGRGRLVGKAFARPDDAPTDETF